MSGTTQQNKTKQNKTKQNKTKKQKQKQIKLTFGARVSKVSAITNTLARGCVAS